MKTLTKNTIMSILLSIFGIEPIFQITFVDSIQHSSSISTKYRAQLSDGLHSHQALLLIENNINIFEEALKKGIIV